jgi:hypothetical protein
MKKVKASAVFRNAAEMLVALHEDGKFVGACYCIQEATLGLMDWINDFGIFYVTHSRIQKLFASIFCVSKGMAKEGFWWGLPRDTPSTNERVFALLLAAEIAESEGD